MVRSSTFMTEAQRKNVAKVAKEEGLHPAQIIRLAVSDWLFRRKQARQQK